MLCYYELFQLMVFVNRVFGPLGKVFQDFASDADWRDFLATARESNFPEGAETSRQVLFRSK